MRHKLVIVIAVVVVAGAVWYALSDSGAPASQGSPLLTTTPAGSGADQELVATLLALRAVKLDGTIFTDPSFMSLRDFSTQIIPEPVGRPNPFAPLLSTASTSAGATHAAQLFTPSR